MPAEVYTLLYAIQPLLPSDEDPALRATGVPPELPYGALGAYLVTYPAQHKISLAKILSGGMNGHFAFLKPSPNWTKFISRDRLYVDH